MKNNKLYNYFKNLSLKEYAWDHYESKEGWAPQDTYKLSDILWLLVFNFGWHLWNIGVQIKNLLKTINNKLSITTKKDSPV